MTDDTEQTMAELQRFNLGTMEGVARMRVAHGRAPVTSPEEAGALAAERAEVQAELDAFNTRPLPPREECLRVGLLNGPPGFVPAQLPPDEDLQ